MRKLRKKEKSLSGDVFTPYLAKLAADFPKVNVTITETRIFIYKKGELDPFVRFIKVKQGWEDPESLFSFRSPTAAVKWAVENAKLV